MVSRSGLTLCCASTWRIGGVYWTAWFFWWFPSQCVWNFSSEFSMHFQNSTISVSSWVSESNPGMISFFCHSFGSDNSSISRISSSGSHYMAPKGGNFSRYSTIPSIRQMNSLIFVLWCLYNPLRRYLFWRWSAFGGKKWAIKSFITNSYFIFVSFPQYWVLYSKTHSASTTTKLLVIPNLWGTI